MSAKRQKGRAARPPKPNSFVTPAAHAAGIPRLIDRISRALRLEEQAVYEQYGAEVAFCSVSYEGTTRGRHRYRFVLPRGRKRLKSGTDVMLLAGSQELRGWVAHSQSNEIEVHVRQLVTGPLTHMTLREDVAWLLVAVRRRLRQLWRSRGTATGSVTPNTRLVRQLLSATSSQRSPVVTPEPEHLDGLNSGQKAAVVEATSKSCQFLWGPPGTGKTTTLARIVEAFVNGGETVLCVAPSNAAADVLADRIAKRLSVAPGFDEGLVVRHGSGVGERIRRLWGSRLVPVPIRERLLREQEVAGDARNGKAGRADQLENTLRSLTSAGTAGWRLQETGRRVVRNLRVQSGVIQAPGTPTPDQLAREATVVVTTAHQLAFAGPHSRMFDTVIFDEASQAGLHLVLLAAAHARKSIIIGGDPRQLPPVIQSDASSVKRMLGTDVFVWTGAVDHPRSSATTMLTEQYRMAPPISDLVSRLSYDGLLTPHRSVVVRSPSALQRGKGSLLYVDTGSAQPNVQRTGGGSRVNTTHVKIADALLRQLIDSGAFGTDTTVAVTSPFAAQAKLLRKALDGLNLDVDTVHSFQGGEADVVIIDLVDTKGLRVSGFLSAESVTDVGARLLNVAMSRAREALIVLADFHTLCRHGGPVVRRLLKELREHGVALPLPAPSEGEMLSNTGGPCPRPASGGTS